MTDSRTWLVTATIPFPTNVTSAIPPEVGDQLQVESRLEPKAFHVEGRKFLFQRGADWPEALGIDFRLEPAEIVTAVNAGDANAALADVESELEIVVESLAFQIQGFVPIWGLDVVDASEPIEAGQQRDALLYPLPQGYPLSTFRPVEQKLQGVLTEMRPDPGRNLATTDHRVERALDWYLKGLAAQFGADQFIFWSVAAELLKSASGIAGEEPYTPQCGHTLHECPECGRATTKPVFGAGMRTFFEQRGRLDPGTARKLWNARQIVHGNAAFDSKKFLDAMSLCQVLRSVVATELKVHLGIPADAPPLVEPEGLAILAPFSLGGEHTVEEEDLAKLRALTGT